MMTLHSAKESRQVSGVQAVNGGCTGHKMMADGGKVHFHGGNTSRVPLIRSKENYVFSRRGRRHYIVGPAEVNVGSDASFKHPSRAIGNGLTHQSVGFSTECSSASSSSCSGVSVADGANSLNWRTCKRDQASARLLSNTGYMLNVYNEVPHGSFREDESYKMHSQSIFAGALLLSHNNG